MSFNPPKIPFIIKCDNTVLASKFTKKEIIQYLLRIISYNMDDIGIESPKEQKESFKSSVATQLAINYSFRNIDTVKEINSLKKIAPVAFNSLIESTTLFFKYGRIHLTNVKLNLSQNNLEIFNSIAVPGEDTNLLEKYYSIRENSILTYTEILEDFKDSGILKVWCDSEGRALDRAKYILNLIEDCVSFYLSSYSYSYSSTYLDDKNDTQKRIYGQSHTFFESMKDEPVYIIQYSGWEDANGLNVNVLQDISKACLLSVEKNYPAMWAQLEKIKIKSLPELQRKPLPGLDGSLLKKSRNLKI